MFVIELETLNDTLCKLVNYLTYLSQHASSWLVVALAAERFYCIYFPLKAKQVCRQKAGLVVVSIIMAMLVCVDSHLLYGLSLFEYENETICDLIDDNYADFFNLYFAWIDISVLFVVPATFIVILNTAIVYKTMNSGKTIRQKTSNATRKMNRHVLVITITICVAFIVLLGPLGVVVIIKPYVFKDSSSFYRPEEKQEMVFDFFASLLAQINHCVNFYLYILAGSRFRMLLKASLCGAHASASASSLGGAMQKANAS